MTTTKDHERDNHVTTGARIRIAAAMLLLGWLALTACGKAEEEATETFTNEPTATLMTEPTTDPAQPTRGAQPTRAAGKKDQGDEQELPSACDLLTGDEVTAFGVDPATATEIRGGEIPALWRREASWCRWSSTGSPSEARSLVVKLDRHDSPEAAASGLAWLEQMGVADHLRVPVKAVPGLGDPAQDLSGDTVSGAVSASLVGHSNPAFAHRDGSFVVARFGATVVELSSTAGAVAATRSDLVLPDLDRRTALVASMVERAELERDAGSSPVVSGEQVLRPLRTGGTADLTVDGVDVDRPVAVTCLGKSPGNTRAPGSVTVAFDGWTLSHSDRIVLLRRYDSDAMDPAATYAWLGEAMAMGGIELLRPGTGTVDAGADFAPLTFDVSVQGVGRFTVGQEQGSDDPSTWSGFTDPDATVRIVGTVDCDAADGEWWWTLPLRGRAATDAPVAEAPPQGITQTGPARAPAEPTVVAPADPVDQPVFPTPFCSSLLSLDEVLAIAPGTLLSTDGHQEHSWDCEWMIDDGMGIDFVAFDLDRLDLLSAEEYFDATYVGSQKPIRIDDGGPGDERFEYADTHIFREGDWVISVTAGLHGSRAQHYELAEQLIDRLGLDGDQ